MICNVRIFLIHPVANAVGKFFPEREVFPDTLLTLLIKLCDTVFFDSLLRIESESFFYLQLHRKTVRVPATLATHMKASHRFVARNSIFKRARFKMVNSGFAVCRRRTFVKYKLPFWVFGARKCCVKNIVLFPKFENLFFTLC